MASKSIGNRNKQWNPCKKSTLFCYSVFSIPYSNKSTTYISIYMYINYKTGYIYKIIFMYAQRSQSQHSHLFHLMIVILSSWVQSEASIAWVLICWCWCHTDLKQLFFFWRRGGEQQGHTELSTPAEKHLVVYQQYKYKIKVGKNTIQSRCMHQHQNKS